MVIATVCKSSTCLLYFIHTNYLKNPSTLGPSLFNIVNLFPLSLSLSHLKIAVVNPLLWSYVSLQSLKDYRLIFSLLKNAFETSQPSTRVTAPLQKQRIISIKTNSVHYFSCRKHPPNIFLHIEKSCDQHSVQSVIAAQPASYPVPATRKKATKPHFLH